MPLERSLNSASLRLAELRETHQLPLERRFWAGDEVCVESYVGDIFYP